MSGETERLQSPRLKFRKVYMGMCVDKHYADGKRSKGAHPRILHTTAVRAASLSFSSRVRKPACALAGG